MRLLFRVLLPLVQVAITVGLLLTNCGVPPFTEASRCGFLDSSDYCPPTPIPAVVAHFVETNLPAVPVLAPLYDLLGGPDRPNLPVLVTLFGLAGIGLWFFVGQFFDDAKAALLKHSVPRRRVYEGLFSVFLITSSCAVLVESEITSFALSSSQLVIRACSLCWLLFGCTALVFQISWSRKDTWRWVPSH